MRTTLECIPAHLITLMETLRAKLQDKQFLARHRVRPQDFTRERQLTFPVVMLFVLQKAVKSIQRHLHEFLDELAGGQCWEPVTAGAWTHARAQLKHTAFIELNQQVVLPTAQQARPPLNYSDTPAELVIRKLQHWFLTRPLRVPLDRKVPGRKVSFNRPGQNDYA